MRAGSVAEPPAHGRRHSTLARRARIDELDANEGLRRDPRLWRRVKGGTASPTAVHRPAIAFFL